MSTEERDSTLAAAARLEESMAVLGAELKATREYGHRNRHMIWALAISLMFDILMSVLFAFVAIQASNASDRATEATSAAAQNRQNARVSCIAGNEARAAQVNLWNYVLDLSRRPNETPEQTKRIDDFRKYVHIVFAQRNCDRPDEPAVQPPTPSLTR